MMFHDMEEDVIRTRIRKFRDEGSHPKNRLVDAAVLVDLVERMLDTPTEDEAPAPEPDFGPSRGDNPPLGEDEEDEPAPRTGLLGRIFK